MKKLIFLIISLFLLKIGFAQSNDAEFLKLKKVYTLNNDGSIDYNESKQIKLLSHFAFHHLYGETFIIYNTNFQKLTINKAFTLMNDGKMVVTPENAFNNVLPSSAVNAPAFNSLREMVVTHTGLEVGAVINLDYTLKTEPGFYNGFMINESLLESSPVADLEIIVNVPKETELHYSLINLIVGEPIFMSENGVDTYIWKFRNLPASSKDWYQPDYNTDRPVLLASTIDFKQASIEFAGQKAIVEKPDSNLKKYVDEIIGEQTDPLKQALALQKYVVNNIKTNNTPIIYRGYNLRSSAEVWKSNYGTISEKAVLLTQLLNLAGIKTVVSTAIPEKFYLKHIGDPSVYENFYAIAEIPKYGQLYLSPVSVSSQNPEFNLGGYKILILDSNAKTPKVIEHKETTSEISVQGSVIVQDSGSFDGKLVVKLTGNCTPYLEMIENENYLEKIISSSGKAEVVEKSKFKKDIVEAELALKPSKQITEINGYFYFEIPFINKGIDSWHYTNLSSQRTAPLQIPYPVNESYEYVFVLPHNMTFVDKSVDYEINNNVGSVKVSYKCVGKEISVTRKIIINRKLISVSEYPEFKKLMDVWNTKKFRNVIFKNA